MRPLRLLVFALLAPLAACPLAPAAAVEAVYSPPTRVSITDAPPETSLLCYRQEDPAGVALLVGLSRIGVHTPPVAAAPHRSVDALLPPVRSLALPRPAASVRPPRCFSPRTAPVRGPPCAC